MNLSKKASYLKGFVNGLKPDNSKDEVIKKIIELLEDIAVYVDGLDCAIEDLTASVADIDETVADLECDFYGDDFRDTFDHDHDDQVDDIYYEVTCPNCGEIINLQEDVLLFGETTCPKCNQPIEFDLAEVMGECDCSDCTHENCKEN